MSFFSNPLINGVVPSWADISVRVSPSAPGGGGAVGAVIGAIASAVAGPLLELGDIKSIDSSSSIELGEQREGGIVIARTRGSKSDEAAWELYASGYQKLLKGLLAVAPRNRSGQAQIGLVAFTINVQYTPPGIVDILEFDLRGCRILTRALNGAEGNDATTVSMNLNPLQVVDKINGQEIVLL